MKDMKDEKEEKELTREEMWQKHRQTCLFDRVATEVGVANVSSFVL